MHNRINNTVTNVATTTTRYSDAKRGRFLRLQPNNYGVAVIVLFNNSVCVMSIGGPACNIEADSRIRRRRFATNVSDSVVGCHFNISVILEPLLQDRFRKHQYSVGQTFAAGVVSFADKQTKRKPLFL
mgnify:CR=1 FL=1